MRRRHFLVGALSFAAAARGAAQPVGNRRRLAVVDVASPIARMHEDSPDSKYFPVFFGELRRLGQIEGQNLIVERYGKEHALAANAPALAAQVVRSNPDVIYVLLPFAQYFKRETSIIPIVTITGDPVATGLVQSLARPGGNITGVSVDSGLAIHAKRIQLLRELHPAMAKLACIATKRTWDGVIGDQIRAAAETEGLTAIGADIELPGSATTYRNAITQAVRDGADAIMVLDSPDALANRAAIAESIADMRIPAIHAFSEAVDAGGLIAYSFDIRELIKRMAGDVDAILRGADPATIPFYQVTKFELSINLKAAKALGLAVPATLLASADKVVE